MPDSIEKILVPVDGSEGAAHAARFAATLARGTGASLHLVHTYDTTTISMMGFKALTGKEIDEAVRRVSQTYFEAARAAINDASLTVEDKVLIGNPAKEIVALAEAIHPDLIVMGSRGQGDFEKLFLGSVSNQVLHHAPCPVTVVR